MAVKIRLSRGGRKKSPFYHIIIADARAPRDGKFIERIGTYNPMTKPASIEIDRDKAFEWLMKGAQPTETVRAMLRFKGVLYRKHLARGVAKGAMDQDTADRLYQEWIATKEAKIEERRAETRKEKEEERKKLFGTPKKKEVIIEAPATEAMEEFKAVDAEATPDAEAPAEQKEEAPKEEAPKTEAPAAEAKTEEAVPAVEEPKAEETKAEETKVEETKAEEPKAEAPAPAAEEVKVEAPTEAAPVAAAAVAATVADEQDDLTKIEGIGPAIAKVLGAASISTYAALASTDAGKVKEILEGAEGNFGMHDPTTWPKQAQMASDGDWDGLKKWQDELDGGKEVTASTEEK